MSLMQTSLYRCHVFWDAAIVHAVDMTQPAQSALPEQSVHTGKASKRQDIGVGHSVFPRYAQDTANTSQVEGVESSLLAYVVYVSLPYSSVPMTQAL